MKFTREQRKSALESLPTEAQAFILDGETTEIIGKHLVGAGLNEDQADEADTQVLYAMYGLQTLDDVINYIAQLTSKDVSALSILRAGLDQDVFSKIEEYKKEATQEEAPAITTPGAQVTDWRVRVGEISEKYGLGVFQKSGLITICEPIMEKREDKTSALFELSKKLGVGEIVAEQIIEELEKRVFSTLEEKKIETISRSPIAKVIMPQQKNEAENIVSTSFTRKSEPERPINLPVAEEDKQFLTGGKIDIPRYIPTSVESVKEEDAKKYEVSKIDAVKSMYAPQTSMSMNAPAENTGFTSPIGSKITYKSATPTPTKEPVASQQIFQVPRINLNTEESVPAPVKPAPVQMAPTYDTPEPALEQNPYMPSEPLEETTQPTPAPQPKPSIPIVKSYTVDPYREPLQ